MYQYTPDSLHRAGYSPSERHIQLERTVAHFVRYLEPGEIIDAVNHGAMQTRMLPTGEEMEDGDGRRYYKEEKYIDIPVGTVMSRDGFACVAMQDLTLKVDGKWVSIIKDTYEYAYLGVKGPAIRTVNRARVKILGTGERFVETTAEWQQATDRSISHAELMELREAQQAKIAN